MFAWDEFKLIFDEKLSPVAKIGSPIEPKTIVDNCVPFNSTDIDVTISEVAAALIFNFTGWSTIKLSISKLNVFTFS